MVGGTHQPEGSWFVSLTDSDIPPAGLTRRSLFEFKEGFRLCGARRLDSLRETGGYDLVNEVWVLQPPARVPAESADCGEGVPPGLGFHRADKGERLLRP